MAEERYDLVVIGSGTAAQVASAEVRAAGWRVAVIDHRPFGGTCALRGCDPKKVLISGAEALDGWQRMRGHGVGGELAIVWRDLIAFKRTFTGPVPQRQEASYAEQGIDTFHGLARCTGADTLVVGERELGFRHLLLAIGAEPLPLAIPGEEHILTSEQFLELEVLPQRIAMVGGGYIAAEFSHIAARAGAKVTILQRAPRLLSHFDPDLVDLLMEKFRQLGIDVQTATTVTGIEKRGESFLVHASSAGSSPTVPADIVVHAAGRGPDLDALDLPAAGIDRIGARLRLNEYLQSVSNPRVYAAGDAANAGPPLTPVAGRDGKLVAANLLTGNRHRPDYRAIPSVAFTIPPIAAVGLGEAEARAKGLKFRVQYENTWDWYTARREGETVYGYKTLVEENSGRILGAHLVGPHADEVINIFALAIRHGLTAADVQAAVFAYPTAASDLAYMV